ncbi:restriction endonuclease subunit S [Microcella alkaliphila]|nr:restriction endonuclease subunit S [Microcella alkaliphila]
MIDGSINWDAVPYCQVDERKQDQCLLREGDLVISRTGANAGAAAYVADPPEGAVFAGYLVRFRANDSLADARFLGYVLQSREWADYVTNTRTGSAQPQLNAVLMGKFAFDLPPLDEQRRIAEVLGALDDLIDTNERLRARCESLAAEQFMSRVVAPAMSSTAGEDDGWLRLHIGDIARVVETGRRPAGGVKGIVDGVPSIGAESIGGIGRFDYSKTKHVPLEFASSVSRGWVESRDVLVYKDGGKPGEFRPKVGMLGSGFPFDRFMINEHVYRVRTDNRVSQEFLYFWLASPPMMEALASAGTGAAVPGINSTAFRGLPIVVPPANLRNELQGVLAPLVDSCLSLAVEAQDLRRTRDELLPLLVSGAVRVRPEGVAA